MAPNTRFTKENARQLLDQLAHERKRQTPDRLEPAWVALHWLARGVRA